MARQSLALGLALLSVGFSLLECAADEDISGDRFQNSKASEAPGNFSIHAEQSTGALDPLASSLHCNNITGQCIPCTPEQQENEPSCRSTGYHQEITCIESFGAHSLSGHAANRTRAPLNISTDNILEGAPLRDQPEAVRNSTGDDEDTSTSDDASREDKPRAKRANGRQLLKEGVSDEERSRAGLRQKDAKSEEDEEGPSDSEVRPEPQSFRKYVTFESCSPWEEETLSVFGFEAIMLSLLVVCSPVVYQRKRKATGAVAMTRVPSSSSRV